MNTYQVVRSGSRGNAVNILQQLLVDAGYRVSVDGVFGPQTNDAVRAFQRDVGIAVDGIVGPNTWHFLYNHDDNKRLTEGDLINAAHDLNVELAAVKAIREVESRGSGFLPDGRPVILFERHIMRRRLLDYKMPADKLMENHPDIINTKTGGYLGGVYEWGRFERAADIHRAAAIESASWGMFQIMGMHWRHLKYPSAEAFYDAMCESEGKQLDAFVRFIKADSSLLNALRNKDWTRVARLYNGPDFAKNQYDTRLESAFERHRNLSNENHNDVA